MASINLILQAYEGDKLCYEHRGSNIWVNNGRSYLRDLISYASFSPLTTFEDRRIRYLGFGIGGDRQVQPAIANNPPMSADYPGTNLQTDIFPTTEFIERPVQITAGVWLKELPIPTYPRQGAVRWVQQFTETDFTLAGTYLVVPISEVGLFLSDANPAVNNSALVAYDTFDSIALTANMRLKASWTVDFGGQGI